MGALVEQLRMSKDKTGRCTGFLDDPDHDVDVQLRGGGVDDLEVATPFQTANFALD